jgi:hypothetical protein
VKPFVKTGDMIDAALEVSGGETWARLSAVVHNMENPAFRVMLAIELNKNQRDRDKNTALIVFPAVIVYTNLAELLGGYMGWELAEESDPRFLINQWAAGSGMADDWIRQKLIEQVGESGVE